MYSRKISKKNHHKKASLMAVLLAVALSAVVYGLMKLENTNNAKIKSKVEYADIDKTAQHQDKKTRLIATGDFIAHDALNNAAKNGSSNAYDYLPFMDKFKDIFGKSDLRFCNQSTPVGGEQFGVSGYPSFNAPAAFAKNMAELGCNLINTASNHSFDKSQQAIDSNVDIWNSIQNVYAVAGQNKTQFEHDRVHYFEKDGLKYAFLAYTTYSNTGPTNNYGVNMYSREFATSQINTAKAEGAKFIIVSMRWGTEYSQDVNSYQNLEAQFLSDQGVSLVLGHGPHVLEPVKKLTGAGGNSTYVWFSLGNFLNAQLEPEALFNGVAVITIDPKTAQIIDVGFLKSYMHYDWTQDQYDRQDLLARKNFSIVPIEQAANLFERSHLKTTINAQNQRIDATLNKYTAVKTITYEEYIKN